MALLSNKTDILFCQIFVFHLTFRRDTLFDCTEVQYLPIKNGSGDKCVIKVRVGSYRHRNNSAVEERAFDTLDRKQSGLG